MKSILSEGRIENQIEARFLADIIRATGFCEPIKSLNFSSQFELTLFLATYSPLL